MSLKMGLLPVLGAICLLFVCALLLFRQTDPSPPGPRGLPMLGSALELPSRLLFLKLDEWSKSYDGFYSFTAVGQRFLVIGRADVAGEILEKMSAVTADRPTIPMAEYMLRHMVFTLDGYGDAWRRRRRIAHESFNARALENYRALFEQGTRDLLKRLVHVDPLRIADELVQFSGKLTYEAMYGPGAGGERQEADIRHVGKMMTELSEGAAPAAFLVNVIPVLGLLPEWLSVWKRSGSRYYTTNTRFLMTVAGPGMNDVTGAGFVASYARMRGKVEGITDEEIAWNCFAIYGGGVETTPYTLHWFIAAMLLYPEVYKRAQAEVDDLVGNRAPTFDDRSQLPYVDAVIKETLRWRPVVPTGLPHRVTEDFRYKDFVIRKGTCIFGNQWTMCRDPQIYPDYDIFRPERFLGENAAPDPPTFGFGRRVCPGRGFAQHTMFLAIANLLWAFDFSRALDDDGLEILPLVNEFDGNMTIHPKPFAFRMTSRGQAM